MKRLNEFLIVKGDQLFFKSKKPHNRTKAGTSLVAQTTRLCENSMSLEQSNSIVLDSIEILRYRNPILFVIAMLQYQFGLRISEVLAITCYDISVGGYIKINSKKGSFERIIHSGISSEYMLRCKSNNVDPFVEINRFYVYREYKKVGLSMKFGDNEKSSVTHLFRHIAGLNAKSVTNDLESRARHLGHKSTKSTQYYGKDQKR